MWSSRVLTAGAVVGTIAASVLGSGSDWDGSGSLAAPLAQEETTAAAEWVHPFDFPQVEDLPDELFVAIEIPQDSFTKYEIDADTGYVFVDRFQSMPVTYPGNYGSITQTAGGDGDPLDALVITRSPLHPGTSIKVRPIGVLKMIDAGEIDDKIVAVPASDIDPDFDEIQTIADLPALEQQRIEAFFRVYKDLPEGPNEVELGGFDDTDAARALVSEAHDAYQEGATATPAAGGRRAPTISTSRSP